MTGRTTISSAAKQTLKLAARGADAVIGEQSGITILIYHRVGAGSGGEMDLEPRVFEDQLSWLRERHRVLTLDDAVQELARPAGTPQSPGVVLTFDDGTADWVDHVLPALDRHGLPATFYVSTDFVDRGAPFPGDGRPVSWSGLRELASSPLATIGSHTHRHLLLDRLASDQVAEELDRSVELLEDHLGLRPDHFCYPKAVAGSTTADAAVRRRFRSAVLAGTRSNRPGVDLHRLARSPIQRSDGVRSFRRKAAGGMRLEDDLRRGLNRLRYRRLAS